MSPKLSKFQDFKKNFKDALLKYIVVKFHNFTWSIQCQIENGGVENLSVFQMFNIGTSFLHMFFLGIHQLKQIRGSRRHFSTNYTKYPNNSN